jgi:hypothetical protein
MKKQTRSLSQTILLVLAATAWAAIPDDASSQPAPIVPERAIETTFVNNHRETITAKVWVDGMLMTLGELPAGERRTFTLPAEVTSGTRYYLLGDSRNGMRIRSERLTGSGERHARFVVGRTARQSYVRYTQ